MLFIYCFGILFLQTAKAQASFDNANGISWQKVESGEVVIAYHAPHGKEGLYLFTYICRVEYDGGRYPGKVVISKNIVSGCQIGFHGANVNTRDFEILSIPSGSVSWEEKTTWRHPNPDHAIAAGYNKSQSIMYICRGFSNAANTHLLVGYTFEHDFCYAAQENYETAITGVYEILVRNLYGLAIGA